MDPKDDKTTNSASSDRTQGNSPADTPPSQEVTVEFNKDGTPVTGNQGQASDGTPKTAVNDAGFSANDTPSLESEAPADTSASSSTPPTTPSTGDELFNDNLNTSSSANDAPVTSAASGSQPNPSSGLPSQDVAPNVTPPTDGQPFETPAQTPGNDVPPVAPVPAPGNKDKKTLIVLVGVAAVLIIAIVMLFFIK